MWRTASAEPSAQELAAAEALFQEAKKLMSAGKYGQACPKLAESQRLDPGGGTLLTLALCHEAEGRAASAWAEFGEALTLALKDGRTDRASVAKDHAERLEPKLSRLTVRVPTSISVLEGLEISEDGAPLGRAAWGTALPVDPGEHVIEAKAPGKKSWSRILLVAPAGDRQLLEIPTLEDEARVTPVVPEQRKEPPQPSSNGKRRAGWIVGAVGVTVLGGASYFGLRAIADHRTAREHCPFSPCSDAAGVQANEDSSTEADLATVGFAVGGVAIGVAAYLLLTTPPSKVASSGPRIIPVLTAEQKGAMLSTAW
jgi:hypothetical protein